MSQEFWSSRILKSLSEPKTLNDLVKEVGLTRQTLSKLLKDMEVRGLVSRSFEKPVKGRPRSLFSAVKNPNRGTKTLISEPLERQDLMLVKFGAFRKLCRLNREEVCTKLGRSCRLKNCFLAIRDLC
jgi:DNA-binding transcriptional regulator GbsR (MarR family)